MAVAGPSANSELRRTGRTTFVNTLCGKKVLESKDCDDPANAHVEEGVRIKPVTVGRLPCALVNHHWGKLIDVYRVRAG